VRLPEATGGRASGLVTQGGARGLGNRSQGSRSVRNLANPLKYITDFRDHAAVTDGNAKGHKK